MPRQIWMSLFLMVYLNSGQASIEGLWQTFDEQTKQPRAIVDLRIRAGRLTGKIVKVYPMPGDTGICGHCQGELKNKPIRGMQIVWQLLPFSDTLWRNGYILDPKTGRVYDASIEQQADKDLLKVRGFFKVAWLGKTKWWRRLPKQVAANNTVV